MAYSIKRHEVDRLLSMTVVLGWELVEEIYEDSVIKVTLQRKLSADILDAAGELEKASLPQ